MTSPNQPLIVLSVALQVLDLGFNLLRVLPATAFYGVTDLTLLALDGNPMATLPEEAFLHLGRRRHSDSVAEQDDTPKMKLPVSVLFRRSLN